MLPWDDDIDLAMAYEDHQRMNSSLQAMVHLPLIIRLIKRSLRVLTGRY